MHSQTLQPAAGSTNWLEQQTALVITRRDFRVSPNQLWQVLMFYEEVTTTPPLFLRWLLPVPLSTKGSKFEIGGEVRCHYSSGHLRKRVTNIVGGHFYAFDVVEQNLPLGGIRVLGGQYALQHIAENRTRIALATRYASANQPRWFCRRIEAFICHCFHRHILTAMHTTLSRREIGQLRTH